MGEIADLTLNWDMLDEGDPWDWRTSCKYCGKQDLIWDCLQAGWRLYDASTLKLHSCQEYRDHKQKALRDAD